MLIFFIVLIVVCFFFLFFFWVDFFYFFNIFFFFFTNKKNGVGMVPLRDSEKYVDEISLVLSIMASECFRSRLPFFLEKMAVLK